MELLILAAIGIGIYALNKTSEAAAVSADNPISEENQVPADYSGPGPFPNADQVTIVENLPVVNVVDPHVALPPDVPANQITISGEALALPESIALAPPEVGDIKTRIEDLVIPSGLPIENLMQIQTYVESWIAAGLSRDRIQVNIDNIANNLMASYDPANADFYLSARVWPVAHALIPSAPTTELQNMKLYQGDSIPANTTELMHLGWIALSDLPDFKQKGYRLDQILNMPPPGVDPASMADQIEVQRTWFMDRLTPTALNEIRSIGLNI
jgi:hypothetical protein